MPHHPELLEDVPQGLESGQGDCGDQEDDGFDLSWVFSGVGDELDTMGGKEGRAFCMHRITRVVDEGGSCVGVDALAFLF